MSKEYLELPAEPMAWVKAPNALEFPESPRAKTEGVKPDLEFPEGEEARKAKRLKGSEAREEKSAQSTQVAAEGKEAKEPYVPTTAHGETRTPEDSLEVSEERQGSVACLCASPRPGRVFARRPLTVVVAVALVGLAVAAVRSSARRLWAVLAVVPLAVGAVVAGVVACGARYAR